MFRLLGILRSLYTMIVLLCFQEPPCWFPGGHARLRHPPPPRWLGAPFPYVCCHVSFDGHYLVRWKVNIVLVCVSWWLKLLRIFHIYWPLFVGHLLIGWFVWYLSFWARVYIPVSLEMAIETRLSSISERSACLRFLCAKIKGVRHPGQPWDFWKSQRYPHNVERLASFIQQAKLSLPPLPHFSFLRSIFKLVLCV